MRRLDTDIQIRRKLREGLAGGVDPAVGHHQHGRVIEIGLMQVGAGHVDLHRRGAGVMHGLEVMQDRRAILLIGQRLALPGEQGEQIAVAVHRARCGDAAADVIIHILGEDVHGRARLAFVALHGVVEGHMADRDHEDHNRQPHGDGERRQDPLKQPAAHPRSPPVHAALLPYTWNSL